MCTLFARYLYSASYSWITTCDLWGLNGPNLVISLHVIKNHYHNSYIGQKHQGSNSFSHNAGHDLLYSTNHCTCFPKGWSHYFRYSKTIFPIYLQIHKWHITAKCCQIIQPHDFRNDTLLKSAVKEFNSSLIDSPSRNPHIWYRWICCHGYQRLTRKPLPHHNTRNNILKRIQGDINVSGLNFWRKLRHFLPNLIYS